MPIGVDKFVGVIVRVGVAVKALDIFGIKTFGIYTGKAANDRIVITSPGIGQTGTVIIGFAGKADGIGSAGGFVF